MSDRDVDLSDPAWEFLEAYELKKAIPEGVPMPVDPDEASQNSSEQQQQPAAPTGKAHPSFSPVEYLVGDRLRTALIVAVSGGGKDILLSNALRSFLKLHPQFSVIVMDCKDDPKETNYYAGLERVTFYRLNLAVSSDSTISAWIDAILDDFNGRPEFCLLICNEGTLIREKSKRYADVVKSLVSSGDSRQKYAWEAGQSAHNEDLKTNGAARSRFRPLMIGMLGEEMQIEAVLQAKWFADSAREMSAITSEMRRSPVSRAWCDGLRWYPMPELQNYSGYDRDSREYLTGKHHKDSEIEKPLQDTAAPGSESEKGESSKTNCSKPKLSRTDLTLAIAELGEWLDKNPGLSFDQSYSNYNARRKNLSRPEFRYLLLRVEQIDEE